MLWIQQMLMIAEGMAGGLVSLEAIEEMDKNLTKGIEDFDWAINIKALRLVKEAGKHTLTQSGKGVSSTGSCRAVIFARVSRTCQGWLWPGLLLYGRYLTIHP